jgi:hypothetical protein
MEIYEFNLSAVHHAIPFRAWIGWAKLPELGLPGGWIERWGYTSGVSMDEGSREYNRYGIWSVTIYLFADTTPCLSRLSMRVDRRTDLWHNTPHLNGEDGNE